MSAFIRLLFNPTPPAAAAQDTQQQTPPQPPPPTIQQQPAENPTAHLSPLARNIRQLSFLLAGAGCMAASIAVSRRSVLRMRRAGIPPFYISNRSPAAFDSSDRSLMAVQALGLATLNVTSFGVLLTGGISWAFDLCSLAELRQRTQAALNAPGNLDEEGEKELEEMVDSMLVKLGIDRSKFPEENERRKAAVEKED